MTKKHYQALIFDDSPSSERMLAKEQRLNKSRVRGCQKVRLSRDQAKDVVRKASFSRAFTSKRTSDPQDPNGIRDNWGSPTKEGLWTDCNTTNKSAGKSRRILGPLYSSSKNLNGLVQAHLFIGVI